MHILLKVFLLFFPFVAYAGEDVGWIDSINGNSTDVVLLRDGAKIDVVKYMALQINDEIKILKSNTSIDVSLSNGKTIKVDRHSPFVSSKSEKLNTRTSNFLKWISSLPQKYDSHPRVISTSSRSPNGEQKLSIPMMKADVSLVAGDRFFGIAWVGGRPPYSIKLNRVGTKDITYKEDGMMHPNFLAKIKIEPGEYDLILTDASGHLWRERIITVSKENFPIYPSDIDQSPDAIRSALESSWLAGLDDGRWVLEAYAKLAAVKNRSAFEDAVLQSMIQGNLQLNNLSDL